MIALRHEQKTARRRAGEGPWGHCDAHSPARAHFARGRYGERAVGFSLCLTPPCKLAGRFAVRLFSIAVARGGLQRRSRGRRAVELLPRQLVATLCRARQSDGLRSPHCQARDRSHHRINVAAVVHQLSASSFARFDEKHHAAKGQGRVPVLQEALPNFRGELPDVA